MEKKRGLSILISIILTVILVSTINIGISLFLNEPNYREYCDFDYRVNPTTEEGCNALNGTWISEKGVIEPIVNDGEIKDIYFEGYCDLYSKCQKEYDSEMKKFDQKSFYILATLGFILLLAGLFSNELLIQVTGLATGGILVFESVIKNLENKLSVFIVLLGILIIFGILAYRVIGKDSPSKKGKKVKKVIK